MAEVTTDSHLALGHPQPTPPIVALLGIPEVCCLLSQLHPCGDAKAISTLPIFY